VKFAANCSRIVAVSPDCMNQTLTAAEINSAPYHTERRYQRLLSKVRMNDSR
jgi:hypothetical protein